MKKTLIFSLAYYPDFIGGAEVAIKEITDRISAEEMSFDMVTAKLNLNQKRFEKIGNINVYRVGLGFKTFDKFSIPLFGFFKAISLNRKNKYDVAWNMMANQVSVAASFFKMATGIPLILTIQEGDEEDYLKRYVGGNEFLYRLFIKPWYSLIFKVSNRATVISKSLKDRVLKNNFKGPILLIPNGVDIENFTRKFSDEELNNLKDSLKVKDSDIVVITTSRLEAKNGVEDIILSLKHLPKNYRLLILGTGRLLYKLQNLTERENLTSRVTFLGFIDHKEVPKYLSISDVFVRPSISEGMGNSFIEAMASRTPVVATPVGGIVDFLKNEESGIFCEVQNPKSIAEAIQFFEKNTEKTERITQNAQKMAIQSYGWLLISKKMLEAFSDFAETRKKIVIATGIYPPKVGGPSYYAQNLENEFIGLGHKVSIATYGIESRLPSGARHLAYFLKLLLKSIKSDFILALDTLSVGLPSVWVKNILKTKVIIRTGGDFLWEQYIERTGPNVLLSDFYKSNPELNSKEKKIFNLTKYILNKVDTIIFSTKYQKDIFVNGYDLADSRIYIVENYYGEKRESIKPKEKNFLWAGRDIKFKNNTRVKEAFSIASVENKDIRVEITTGLPQKELFDKIASCYAVLNISIGEISPNFILESMSFNKPFILSQETGIYDRVKDIAVFTDPMDVKDIKEKILYLADDENYKKQVERVVKFNFVHTYKDIAREILEIAKY